MKILPPPGPARTRQLALLGVLLVAAAFAVSRLLNAGTASSGIPASNSQAPAAPLTGTTSERPQPLNLKKLEPGPEAPVTTRNPFRFGVKPVAAAPAAPPSVPPSAALPPIAAPSGAPPIVLKFIGRVVMPDGRVVGVLSDAKGHVFEGLEGQIVDGRYRIVRIGEESLVIEHVDGTARTTLQLRGS